MDEVEEEEEEEEEEAELRSALLLPRERMPPAWLELFAKVPV